jgi:hypothetical protein
MYINTGYDITNTPSNVRAAYNTWPYVSSTWYQHVPTYYIDNVGQVREWVSWNRPNPVYIPGGRYAGTPTRTGSYYIQNTILGNTPVANSSGCSCRR